MSAHLCGYCGSWESIRNKDDWDRNTVPIVILQVLMCLNLQIHKVNKSQKYARNLLSTVDMGFSGVYISNIIFLSKIDY